MLFVVAMVIAVLASVGLYALAAASIEVRASGNERQNTQTHYLAEYGILAAIDPTELGYVVTNLTDNAVKYGTGEIAVRVRAENSAAVIEVADQGPGIPSTDVARVFDRFYRGTQRDVAGSGLGLAIVRRAVERAHGTVSLDTSSTGSRFIVHLPRA